MLRWFLWVSVSVFLLSLAPPRTSAQFIRCSAAASAPAVRAEGIAEIVGDVLVTCRALSEAPPSLAGYGVRISVSLNVNITNNIGFLGENSFTDAVLVAQEANCTAPSSSAASSCDPVDDRFPGPRFGELTAQNRLTWEEVFLPIPGKESFPGVEYPAIVALRISGIRANVSQLAAAGSPTFPATPVTAVVNVEAPTPIPIDNNLLAVGVPVVGVETAVSGVVDGQFGLVMTEQFERAFLPEGNPTFSPADRRSESGYFAPGSNNGGGASSGTRLLVRWFDVAAGTKMSVPRQVEYGRPELKGDALRLSLVSDADSDGQGGTPTTALGQYDLTFADGFGRVVYEVTDANPKVVERVVIPVTIEAGSAGGSALIDLAPLSTVTNASKTEAEPRFVGTLGSPAEIAEAPAAATPVQVRLESIPSDDRGVFSVAVEGVDVLNGPAGSFGSAEFARGSTVAIAVSPGTGTSILDYETKIRCTGGGLTQPLTATFSDAASAPRTLSLAIPPGGGAPVECRVLNRNTAQAAVLTGVDLTQTVLPAADLGMFEIVADGSTVVSGGDGGEGSTDVEQGGSFVVEQRALVGTTLTDFGTSIVCSGGGVQGEAKATFAPGDGQARRLTFDVPAGDGSRVRCDVRSESGAVPATKSALATPPPITCILTSIATPVRAEGLAEHTEDVVLVCSAYETSDIPQVIADFSVSLNTSVTNNIDFGQGRTTSDAVLVINENNCTTPSALGSGCASFPDGRFQGPQYGELVDQNRLLWRNVALPTPGALNGPSGQINPLQTTIRITNLRVRAEELGVTSSAPVPATPISASVAISGSAVPVNNHLVSLGIPAVGLVASLNPAAGNDVEMTLEEGFASAFKTQGFASFNTGLAQFEAGYFTPGSNGGDGASSGTRLLLRFFGLDEGTEASVPRQLDVGSTAATEDGLHLALVKGHDENGAGGSVTTLFGSHPVPLSGGSGLVVYEVLDTNQFEIDQIVVPIQFSVGSLGTGLIDARLGPVSSETEASSDAPEPRFQDAPVRPLPPVGPTITNATASFPQGASPGLPVVVRANIEDAESAVSSAFVTIRDIQGRLSEDFPMTSSGGNEFEARIDTSFYREGVYDVTITASDSESPPGRRSLPAVLQFWLRCSISSDPNGLNRYFDYRGGTGFVEIFASGTCGWSVHSPYWITTNIVDGDRVEFVVAPNTDSSSRQDWISFPKETSFSGSQPWRILVSQDGAPPRVASKTGTYSDGIWRLDANGNGVFEPGTDRSFALGFPGAQHFVGDWDGDGRDQSGVYADGFWFLDFNGDDVWDGGIVDKQFPFGFAGATPVVGDWNGDGATDVGVYSNGFWFLDGNGDRLWDGGVEDVQFGFGWPGVEILVGDWNGDGRDKVGVFSSGFWFLDYDGDYQWDGGTVDRAYGWGWSGVKPIVGDWNGDGRDKAGAWINGVWVLDYDGDASWDGGTTDRIYGWGASNSTPVIGDWNNDGVDSAGAFLDGEWVLDVNGDALWDGGTVDQLFNWGDPGDQPVVGRW